MKEKYCCSEKTRIVLAYFVGVMGSFLIIGVLSWLVVGMGEDDLEAERAEVRRKSRMEVQVAARGELDRYAIDPNKADLAKISIGRAMEILVSEWEAGSDVGREKLLERLADSKEVMSFE
jgi:hypothetical protein